MSKSKELYGTITIEVMADPDLINDKEFELALSDDFFEFFEKLKDYAEKNEPSGFTFNVTEE